MIHNPVLRGFEPDPVILRVGAEDYYIATSTFEWYPGVRLHHSRDLVNWRALGGALDSRRLLDLAGVPDSGGIWAPGLSYADGLFHLVFTVVDTYAEGWKDLPNHVTTAPSIEGPWSDPVPLHGRGFDVSLFHDRDGRSWLLNMRFDWRPEHDMFAGIELQEYDRTSRKLLGQPRTITVGTAAGVAEGPHLYRRGDWYYLVHAEGGTGYEHGAAVARSRDLFGPYEPDPAGPLLTSRHDPTLDLQKAGHCSLVETPGGEWYAAHITARPHTERGRCVLGRETALQPVTWTEEGWPRIAGGIPAVTVPAPALPPAPFPAPPATDHFDAPLLGPDWSTLRRPADEDWLSLTECPGSLRIRGGQPPAGRRSPSLVARRVTSAHCSFETRVTFDPHTPDHLAGVTAYYNTRNWHYLYVTSADDGSPVLHVLSCEQGARTAHPVRVPLAPGTPVVLRAELDGPVLRFSYDTGGGAETLPLELDATVLSDEAADEFHDGQLRVLGFTGAMLGLWVQDLDGAGVHADFGHATYEAVTG
ncbi:glycoside hydrolase family 43 protein [Streptomyces sp. NBC_01451]|uniref:glycoside hydrolase family 43 protein n=1 Tax=Streptomyces sp. NBC_01451 TaxID=2903872 RepID=UPI002E30E271|nr:glycoside hydrolase family 43 protein [Streptomyces sp. NBC_01451]